MIELEVDFISTITVIVSISIIEKIVGSVISIMIVIPITAVTLTFLVIINITIIMI